MASKFDGSIQAMALSSLGIACTLISIEALSKVGGEATTASAPDQHGWFVDALFVIGALGGSAIGAYVARRLEQSDVRKNAERMEKFARNTQTLFKNDLTDILSRGAKVKNVTDFEAVDVDLRATISVAENFKESIYELRDVDMATRFERQMKLGYRMRAFFDRSYAQDSDSKNIADLVILSAALLKALEKIS